MMGALLQLERFDLAPAASAPLAVYAQSDLDEAFAEGLAQGRRQVEAQQVAQLCAALAGLSERLDAERAARAAAGAAEVHAIAPLIGALLDGLIPAVARARLEASLLQELLHLAEAVPPLAARIRCGRDLAAFTAACLARTGLAGIEIDPSGPEGTVEAELRGGLVTWDAALVAAQLRDLMNEVMEVE